MARCRRGRLKAIHSLDTDGQMERELAPRWRRRTQDICVMKSCICFMYLKASSVRLLSVKVERREQFTLTEFVKFLLESWSTVIILLYENHIHIKVRAKARTVSIHFSNTKCYFVRCRFSDVFSHEDWFLFHSCLTCLLNFERTQHKNRISRLVRLGSKGRVVLIWVVNYSVRTDRMSRDLTKFKAIKVRWTFIKRRREGGKDRGSRGG